MFLQGYGKKKQGGQTAGEKDWVKIMAFRNGKDFVVNFQLK